MAPADVVFVFVPAAVVFACEGPFPVELLLAAA